jgi:hypothetical protein
MHLLYLPLSGYAYHFHLEKKLIRYAKGSIAITKKRDNNMARELEGPQPNPKYYFPIQN